MALQSERLAIGVIAIGAIVAMFLYSVLIQRAPLQMVGFVVPVVFLYFVWRFVRAHERLAEAVADSVTRGSGIESTEE